MVVREGGNFGRTRHPTSATPVLAPEGSGAARSNAVAADGGRHGSRGCRRGIVGTFLQFVVFGLGEQELLTEAGVWGYVAAVLLLALMVLPAVTGIVLGVRARRLGEHRRGTTGIIVNAVVATYLVFTVAATLLFG